MVRDDNFMMFKYTWHSLRIETFITYYWTQILNIFFWMIKKVVRIFEIEKILIDLNLLLRRVILFDSFLVIFDIVHV